MQYKFHAFYYRSGIIMRSILFSSLLFSFLVSPLVSAHHGPPSDPALFNTERIIELDAVVIAVFWRNPHVRFKAMVQGPLGEEEWQIELRRGPTSFRNVGLQKDFLKPGDKIKIAGYPSRRKANLLGMMNLLLPDGRELVEPNVETRFSDVRMLSGPRPAISELDGDQNYVKAEPVEAEGIFRVWGMADSRIPETPVAEYVDYFSNTAHALRARYVAARDDPELKCQSGMPSTMFDPPPMEIRHDGDNVILHMEEYDIIRTIHMDGGIGNPEPSRLGYSVGKWEADNILVIHTTHINWPFFDPWGTPQSDQISYVERFELTADERLLKYSLTADDPVMFVEPIVLERAWRWLPARTIQRYDCTLWEGDVEYDPEKSNPFKISQGD
jgi:hypothetical protein